MFGTKKEKRTVAINARVSTEHEAQLNAIENQKQWYFEFVRNHPDWSFYEMYADEGITGTSAEKRPNFMRMMEDAKENHFDLIITVRYPGLQGMDDWFSGIDTLAYVSAIPSSVKSMTSAFSECSSLKKGADWSRCDSLINVSECYKGCESLSEFSDLPASVIIADHMCEGCISLEKTGNLSKAVKLKSAISMYQDCTNITEAGISPNVETIAYAYAGCINLRSMPVIPETVKAMEGCFEGDISLQHLTNLPANVVNISSCFSGCSKIEGNLMIDCNPVEYSNLFLGAAVATKVHLAGKSNIINELIDECNNDNISVAE